jgi:predicted RNase H-like HicB family nuclease
MLWLAPLALWAGAAIAQDQPEKPKPDDKFRPEAPKKDEEEDLTPEKAMQMLKEVKDLQELASDLLNASSQGKALETEKELLDKVKKLIKEDPKSTEDAQKKVLQTIERLMGKSEGNQKDAVDKMGEIIRKAKS